MTTANDRTIRIDVANVPLYHGGIRGLRPGELLLPPLKTGQPTADLPGVRPDRVYLTIDLDAARFFAALYVGQRRAGATRGRNVVGRGVVYEARPLDTALEPDPDAPPGISIMVPAARITRVVERQVRLPDGIDPVELAEHMATRGGVTHNEIVGIGRRTLAAGRA